MFKQKLKIQSSIGSDAPYLRIPVARQSALLASACELQTTDDVAEPCSDPHRRLTAHQGGEAQAQHVPNAPGPSLQGLRLQGNQLEGTD